MMSRQIDAPDRGELNGAQHTSATPTVVQQAGQIMIDGVMIAVHRTLADEHSPYVVLRTRHGDETVDLAVRPGQGIEVPGVGRLLVVDVRASSRQMRGAVALLHR